MILDLMDFVAWIYSVVCIKIEDIKVIVNQLALPAEERKIKMGLWI